MAAVRNSFYDGESDLTIATTAVTSEQLTIDSSVQEAQLAETNALASAASALASEIIVEAATRITTYAMSDGSASPEQNVQSALEMQETKLIYGGSF